MREQNADFTSDIVVYFCMFFVQLAGVSIHSGIIFRRYSSFKHPPKDTTLGLILTDNFGLVFLMVYSIFFQKYYHESPNPIQWFLVYPLIPAFVAPVIFTSCLGCSFFRCWKKRNESVRCFLCNPLALIVCIVTLPFTLLLNSLIFWLFMSVAMYPFEVGLGLLVITFPSFLCFFLLFFIFRTFRNTTCGRMLSPIMKSEPFNMKQTRELAETQLTEIILLLGGIVSFMFAFFFMYYMLFVANGLINSQNPLQTFLSVILPTAAFSAVTWAMRKLQKTTNVKSDNTKRVKASYGAVGSDEDSHIQLLRNVEVHEDDANDSDQESETSD